MLKKPDQSRGTQQQNPAWDDPTFKDMYPNLVAHLTQTQWADRSPRQTSTLTMYFDGFSMVVVLNDRDNERSAFFSGRDFTALLDVVEKGLSDDSCEWKARRSSQPRADKIPF